jgi:hypothetical protein
MKISQPRIRLAFTGYVSLRARIIENDPIDAAPRTQQPHILKGHRVQVASTAAHFFCPIAEFE